MQNVRKRKKMFDRERFCGLLDHCFSSNREAAEYLHVDLRTVKRWRAKGCPNASAVKLLMIKARGYLPNTSSFEGWRIVDYYGHKPNIITPSGQRFNLAMLEAHAYWYSQFEQLKAEKAARERDKPKLIALNGGKN